MTASYYLNIDIRYKLYHIIVHGFPTLSDLDSRLESQVHGTEQRFDSEVIQIDAVINFE